MTMKPNLIKNEKGVSFEWMGHLVVKGLFDGHHQFLFEKVDDNTTKFIQKENFPGVLIRVLKKSVLDPTEKDFAKMNQTFKAYVEANSI